MPKINDSHDSTLAHLVACGQEILAANQAPGTQQGLRRWLLVDVSGQRLALLQDDQVAWVRPVSTALAGIDCRQDSGGTPSGLHRVEEKIGEGCPWGTVFESRRPIGMTWAPGDSDLGDDDLILTRILTLDGLEDGVNRGPNVDSLTRYIYIHGTNHEGRIGNPVSHGCIRMANDDVMDLFDQVETGDPVLII